MPPTIECNSNRVVKRIDRGLVRQFQRIIVFLLVFQMMSCGALLYPERRGQQSGKIDSGVAVLDAAGLIFFIVPGVIAFAVDFATGAIFLPPGTKTSPLFDDLKKSSSKSKNESYFTVVRIDPTDLDEEKIETVLSAYLGKTISLNHPDVISSKVKNQDELINEYEAWVLNDKIFNHVSY